MTFSECERIIERLKAQNVQLDIMYFTGGEPTLWEHLKIAINKTREYNIAKRIGVCSNGVGRNASDYGGADFVQVTDYGAMNRLDIIRLKKQLGKKLEISAVTHYPIPQKQAKNSLPADCTCVNLHFCGDKVYSCGRAMRMNIGALSIDEDFYSSFMEQNPYISKLCTMCLANKKVKNKIGLSTVFYIPDSYLYFCWNTKFRATALRSVYRKLRWHKKH